MSNWMWMAAILVACAYLANGAPEGTCKEFVSMLTKKQLGGISACSKTMKFKNPKEKAAKMNCILKCVLKKEGLLDENGQFIGEDKYDGFIEAYVPSNLVDKVIPKILKCKDAGEIKDDGDEFCKSLDPLIKCFLDMIGTLCKDIA